MQLNVAKKSPRRPWISYDAADQLARLMSRRPCSVLEFGSGNSTIWFATRGLVVEHSVEHNPEWYTKVQHLLALTPHSASVLHELRKTIDEYTTFRADGDKVYDIILIDGIWRLAVARHHVDKLAPDGVLYLDNSDANSSFDCRDEIPELLSFLDNWCEQTGRVMEIYTDFSPTALHATQGRLYRKAAKEKTAA